MQNCEEELVWERLQKTDIYKECDHYSKLSKQQLRTSPTLLSCLEIGFFRYINPRFSVELATLSQTRTP